MITMIMFGCDITWITQTGIKRDAVGPKFWTGIVTGIEVRQDPVTGNSHMMKGN